MDWCCCLNYSLLSFIKYILSFYFLMSDTYTYPRTVPELVQDVSLKRARVELESGETAIRTTSGSSVDVTAISNALGQQTDPASEASVIGLLKNLIANSGGGGSVSTSYPVFKSELYQTSSQTFQVGTYVSLSSLLPSGSTVPEWTKYIVFSMYPESMYVAGLSYSSPVIVNKSNPCSVSLSNRQTSLNDSSYTIMNREYHFRYQLINNEPSIQAVDYQYIEYIYRLNEEGFGTTVAISTQKNVTSVQMKFLIIFLDTDPLEIASGGGSGGTVETYNLTINNVSATNITAPISSPPSADDQTLASKAYVDSQVTSKSLSYQPVSEQQLNIYTSYSIAALLGQATWDFPFSGGGSMDFVFSYSSAPGRNIWYRCHVPLPSYLNTQNTPKIHVALAQISHYPITDDTNGELQGILLEYDTAAKTIQFIGGEGVIVNNGSDALQTAYNQGDLHPWFWGLTCNTFI